ncbi:MAG: histidine kinase [Bacteroidia bacterium]|nr:histidine kinase [Bacteroidia bacterium]
MQCPLRIRLICFSSILLHGTAVAQLDSLKQLSRATKGEKRVEILQEIAYQSLFSEPDSAFSYAQSSLEEATALHLDSLEAEAYIMLGFSHFVKGENEQAESAYQQAANLHQARGDFSRQAAALSNLASTFNRAGRLEAALKVTLESLQLFEQQGDSLRFGLLLGNAGNLYQGLRQLEEAKIFIRHSAQVLGRLGQTKFVGNTHNMLGSVLFDQDSLPQARDYFLKALALYKIEDDMMNRSGAYNNLGALYQADETLDSALYFFQKAFDLSSELESAPKMLLNAANIAEIHLYFNDRKLATFWINRATAYAAQTHELQPLAAYYRVLAIFQGLGGDLMKSFASHRLSERYRDSIMNLEKERAITDFQVKYETEKKDRELAESALLLEKKEKESQQLILGGLALLLSISAIAAFLWYRNRLEQREAIHQERLIQQEIRLETTIQTQEEERSRLARDLHDGIGQLLSATRLNFGVFADKIPDPNYGKSLLMLDEACKEVREVAHLIMPRSLEEEGIIVSIEEMLAKTLGNTTITYQIDKVGQLERLAKKYEINIYRIAQELIQNILKHAMASEVHVQLIRRPDRFLLIVEDNGKGMGPQQSKDGIGMINIMNRAKTIDATFYIENGPESGTIATLRIPL